MEKLISSEELKRIRITALTEEIRKLKADNRKLLAENKKLQEINDRYCKFIGGTV